MELRETMDLKEKIRSIPDFPKKGIIFKDITTLLKDAHAFRHAMRVMLDHFDGRGITVVASMESRGFIFGSVLAYELNAGFVPLRKPGKLPYVTIRCDCVTEYSEVTFEMHADAISRGDRVLIVDDLLATGGTARASADLIERQGGKVEGLAFLIELGFLKGRERLQGYDVLSVINYETPE